MKLLQETYLGRVKMIYIDPPYNTGKDFIYKDNFAEAAADYLLRSGQRDGNGNHLTANTDGNGRFHSDWLSFIYPRLKLARNLLRDDGVIFISIDDNEVHNLCALMNEVFGEANFIVTFLWNSTKGAQGMVTKHMIVNNHEYVLVYARFRDNFHFTGIERDERDFSNPDNDPRGKWKRQYLQRFGQNLPVRSISDPATGKLYNFETPYTQEKLAAWVQDGRILFPQGDEGYPARKEFLSEYKHKKQLVTTLGLYSTKSNTEKLYSLFEDRKIFTNPKPNDLLKYFVQTVTDKNDIILDFFAGSCTTAHAVMQLNAEDGGKRRFIMVQLPEPCEEKSEAYKAGYQTIAAIGRERIRRAGRQLVHGDCHQDCHENWNKDFGFRALAVDSSNMADVYYTPAALKQSDLLAAVDTIKPGRDDPEDLLFQVLLDWGIELTLPIRARSVQGKRVLFVGEAPLVLIACFDGGITDALVKELAAYQPQRVVFCDKGFACDSVKINAAQIFHQLSPATDVKSI